MATNINLKQKEIFVSACSPERFIEISLFFNKRSNGYVKFWDYIKYFEDPLLSFTDIGSCLGVTRQAIHQIYKTWFSEIFPDRAFKRRRIKYLPELLQGVRLEIQKAKTFNYLPKELKMKPWIFDCGAVAKTIFLIQNGKKNYKCKLSRLNNFYNYGTREAFYSRLESNKSSFEEIDFLIVHQTIPDEKSWYYVLPVNIVLLYANSKSITNLALYRNAWNLLQGEKT